MEYSSMSYSQNYVNSTEFVCSDSATETTTMRSITMLLHQIKMLVQVIMLNFKR